MQEEVPKRGVSIGLGPGVLRSTRGRSEGRARVREQKKTKKKKKRKPMRTDTCEGFLFVPEKNDGDGKSTQAVCGVWIRVRSHPGHLLRPDSPLGRFCSLRIV